MKWDELRDLDLRDIKISGVADWPAAGKAVIFALIIIIVLVIGYFLVVRNSLDALDKAQAQEVTLRQQFERKQRLAVNLKAYERQHELMHERFDALLMQLPSKTEIDDLLADISQTARADGLVQQLFQPGREQRRNFYVEKPIAMVYTGSWQQIARFVSDVSSLPRIVSLHNFTLNPVRAGAGDELQFKVTAVTYRYVSDTGGKKGGKK